MKRYIVLTGAKKNLGDYLITERCKKLLRKHKPKHELLQLPGWESLAKYIKEVNESSAIIIMGGPGYQPRMYPKVYKLMDNLDDIKVPIIPMGLGWKGIPGDYKTLVNYEFTLESKRLLNRMSEQIAHLSCRDYMSSESLSLNGIDNALMTGCPVWYDLDSIGKEIKVSQPIRRVVYTPAQRPMYRKQSIEILKMLKKLFPEAELICSFHRGIEEKDKFTNNKDGKNNLKIAESARGLGWKIVDVSSDLKKIEFYDDCDLHVGYRVHGHLYFISKRKPSFLLHEDGRGRGVSESINLMGIDAFGRSAVKKFKPDNYAVLKLQHYIQEELANNFKRFHGVSHVIDAHYEVMKKFIASIPE